MDVYVDKFERIVDLLRYTGSYNAVAIPSTTQYTVTSDIDTHLAVGDYLTLGLVKVRVISLTSSKIFVVDSVDGLAVDLAGTWKALAPYSDYGTRKTINTKLKNKNGGEYSYQKYPLIALRIPSVVNFDGEVATQRANILIATFTNKGYEPQMRMLNVFKPILYPLMNRFLDMCKRSGEFISFTMDHDQIDRMFYGTEVGGEDNTANVFDDPLDAVELVNLEFKFLVEGCDPPNF